MKIKLMIWVTIIVCISSMRSQNCNRKFKINVYKRSKSQRDFSLVSLFSDTVGSSANFNPLSPLRRTELSDTFTSNMINGYDMRNIIDKKYDFMEYYEKIYKIESLLKKTPLYLHPLEEHKKQTISPINIKITNDFDDIKII